MVREGCSKLNLRLHTGQAAAVVPFTIGKSIGGRVDGSGLGLSVLGFGGEGLSGSGSPCDL
jgi:hypothetical protein